MRIAKRLVLAFGLTAALAAGGASQALAANASGALEYCTGSDACRYFPSPRLRVTFTAAPGEANVVSGVVNPNSVRIRDDGATITAGASCSSVDSHQVDCGPPGPEGMLVEVPTGDTADAVNFGFASRTDLGPGNDTGLGGTQPDLASGGDGNDRLLGRAGDDTLDGGNGNDFVDGQAGNDELTGGSGKDRVVGDSGSDHVSGATGDDRLSGNAGNDRLLGGAGGDRLNGGRGQDRLSGGSGRDYIAAADNQRDKVFCGRGRDRVTADRIDVLVGCERVSFR
ncbi:MAG TPA: calcium-binding protein [Thermoleophilaceae bacterium]|jgi:Ca2+-binding RTX toxin-like protein